MIDVAPQHVVLGRDNLGRDLNGLRLVGAGLGGALGLAKGSASFTAGEFAGAGAFFGAGGGGGVLLGSWT
jgi:hypothetical protein